ncbi:hypothetical protein C8R43DRAFT_968254 [Mycena crocata]|nr:hypothetical protein C8R43DRAFT_968254 [Mycena crocata]
MSSAGYAVCDIACVVAPLVATLLFLNLHRLPILAPAVLSSIMGSQQSNTDSNESDPPDYYPSSPNDVFRVRHFLSNILPPELVNVIIDDAEYWPKLLAEMEYPEVLSASSNRESNAALCCLVTPPFPSSEDLAGPLRVKRVQFDIVSNDQGWGGQQEDHGTYHGSYTWFEAAILRPEEVLHMQSAPSGARAPRPFDHRTPADTGRRWLVQRNLCATKTPRNHTVTWRPHIGPADEELEAEIAPEEKDPRTNGSGDGDGFIDLLASEDRIAVIARARYPGWVNKIQSVQVQVYYAV